MKTIYQIEGLNDLMQGHKEYLHVKHLELKPEIDEEMLHGKEYDTCFFCGLFAAEINNNNFPLIVSSCRVCDMQSNYLVLSCPTCKEKIHVIDLWNCKCKKCGFVADLDFLFQELCPNIDPKEDSNIAYCAYCEHTETPTVIPLDTGYLCLNCFEIHETIDHCEWCNEPVAGISLENSHNEGCIFCDGVH